MRLPQIDYLRLVYRAWRYRLVIDADEIRYLRRTVLPADQVIDAGAHKGGYSYWLSKFVGRSGHVTAFEPQPELASLLAPLHTVECNG